MRAVLIAVLAAACGGSSDRPGGLPDAGEPTADAVEAGGDAAPSCQPTVLLTGGSDVVAQGWTLVMQAPETLTVEPDNIHLVTTTNVNGRTSGQLLLSRAGVVEPGTPFKLEVVMAIASVSPHNQLDAAAAIMGSFTPSVGNPTDRGEMIYLDRAKIGFAADDTKPFSITLADGSYRAYELFVDATGTAQISIDGSPVLTRSNFTTNGIIAIGDQTNDPNVDSDLRIRSVSKLCL